MNDKEWNDTIESWGFEFVNDYAPRHVMNNDGKELSIMSFEDDEFEVAWIDEEGEIKERSGAGIENLKRIIDKLVT